MDDEADILKLTKRILEKNGFQVVTASNGDEALLKAEAEMPNLTLLDLVMFGKSGLEVCKILKAQSKTKHIPVVIFTALSRDVDRKLTAEAGADGHFTKPFTPEALILEVTQRLKKAREGKFSEQLGVTTEKLTGTRILFEFDPSAPYERIIRDFALERVAHNEAVIIVTKRGSATQQALQGEKGIELLDATPDLMLSPIMDRHRDAPISLVYDSLTDLALSTDMKTAYGFARNAIELVSARTEPSTTCVFLLNPAAHEQKEVYSLKGLFSSQATYGKQGITNVKIS